MQLPGVSLKTIMNHLYHVNQPHLTNWQQMSWFLKFDCGLTLLNKFTVNLLNIVFHLNELRSTNLLSLTKCDSCLTKYLVPVEFLAVISSKKIWSFLSWHTSLDLDASFLPKQMAALLRVDLPAFPPWLREYETSTSQLILIPRYRTEKLAPKFMCTLISAHRVDFRLWQLWML